MKNQSSEIIVGFLILALIFSLNAIYTSWWRISTSRFVELCNGTKISVEYYPLQKVKVYIQSEENRTIEFIPIANITSNTNINLASKLQALNNTILGLMATETILCIAITVIILIKGRNIWILPYVTAAAALLALIAVFYFVSEINLIISALQNAIPETFANLSNIEGFWGQSYQTWHWGPTNGWFSTFAAFLLNCLNAYLIKFSIRSSSHKEEK